MIFRLAFTDTSRTVVAFSAIVTGQQATIEGKGPRFLIVKTHTLEDVAALTDKITLLDGTALPHKLQEAVSRWQEYHAWCGLADDQPAGRARARAAYHRLAEEARQAALKLERRMIC